jgi:hypothetical protein
MIRITISAAAFEAISATMPLGSVGYEPEPDAKGERWIWLEPRFVDRLRAMRGPGESYSDVILRLWRKGEARSLHIVADCHDAAPAARSPQSRFGSAVTSPRFAPRRFLPRRGACPGVLDRTGARFIRRPGETLQRPDPAAWRIADWRGPCRCP